MPIRYIFVSARERVHPSYRRPKGSTLVPDSTPYPEILNTPCVFRLRIVSRFQFHKFPILAQDWALFMSSTTMHDLFLQDQDQDQDALRLFFSVRRWHGQDQGLGRRYCRARTPEPTHPSRFDGRMDASFHHSAILLVELKDKPTVHTLP